MAKTYEQFISEAREISEATRSKYLKIFGKHKVGTDTSALELARKKHDAAIMRRGGASPEAVKRGLANQYGIDHEIDMAKYRFANKRAKHLDKAIGNYNRKASKTTATEMNMQLDTGEYIIDDPMHLPDHLKGFADRFLAPKTATMGMDKYTGNGFYPGS